MPSQLLLCACAAGAPCCVQSGGECGWQGKGAAGEPSGTLGGGWVHAAPMREEFFRRHVAVQVALEAGQRWRALGEQALAGRLQRAPANIRGKQVGRLARMTAGVLRWSSVWDVSLCP